MKLFCWTNMRQKSYYKSTLFPQMKKRFQKYFWIEFLLEWSAHEKKGFIRAFLIVAVIIIPGVFEWACVLQTGTRFRILNFIGFCRLLNIVLHVSAADYRASYIIVVHCTDSLQPLQTIEKIIHDSSMNIPPCPINVQTARQYMRFDKLSIL